MSVARSSAVQASSTRRQEGGVGHRLWLPAVAIHRLGVVEIAPISSSLFSHGPPLCAVTCVLNICQEPGPGYAIQNAFDMKCINNNVSAQLLCSTYLFSAISKQILFSIYYDELITRLSSSRYGYRLSGKSVGALAYADDTTLLCPSLHGLQKMVNICADFGTDYHVTFNDKKTNCIMFGTSAAWCKCISVNDNEIMWSNRVKHLGDVIDCEYYPTLLILIVRKVISLLASTGL